MLTVTGKSAGDAMTYYGGEEDDTTKYITDDTIKEIAGVEHVTLAAPVYEMSAYALKGKYMGYINLIGTTKEAMESVSAKKRVIQSIVCGVLIGFICGFVGAGGGMMMLLILTSVLGYELKTAVGTSVFIMAFTAFTGAVSHFAIGGMPDWTVWILCVIFTLLWARIAAVFANKATPKTLNRVTGVILVILGIVVMSFSMLTK